MAPPHAHGGLDTVSIFHLTTNVCKRGVSDGIDNPGIGLEENLRRLASVRSSTCPVQNGDIRLL